MADISKEGMETKQDEVVQEEEPKQEEEQKPEWEQVLPGSTGVLKKTLVPGDAAQKAEYGQMIKIRYTGRIQETGDIFLPETETTMIVGDGEVMPGLEVTARLLGLGEKCTIKVESRLGYSSKQHGTVPPNTDLELDVELLELMQMKTAPGQMSLEDRVAGGLRKKTLGNEAYKLVELETALKLYQQGLGLVQCSLPEDEQQAELHATLKQVRVDCANNIVQVYMKLGKDKEAKDACIEVLKLDAENVKALLKAGTLCLKENEFEEAAAVIAKAAELAPDHDMVKRLKKNLIARKKAYAQKTRDMFGGKLASKKTKDSSNKKPEDKPEAPSKTSIPPSTTTDTTDTTDLNTETVAKAEIASSLVTARNMLFVSIAVGVAAAGLHFVRSKSA